MISFSHIYVISLWMGQRFSQAVRGKNIIAPFYIKQPLEDKLIKNNPF